MFWYLGVRGFPWVYSEGWVSLLFISENNWAPSTCLHLVLSMKSWLKKKFSMTVFNVSCLPWQPPGKGTASSPLFLVFLISIAKHWQLNHRSGCLEVLQRGTWASFLPLHSARGARGFHNRRHFPAQPLKATEAANFMNQGFVSIPCVKTNQLLD